MEHDPIEPWRVLILCLSVILSISFVHFKKHITALLSLFIPEICLALFILYQTVIS